MSKKRGWGLWIATLVAAVLALAGFWIGLHWPMGDDTTISIIVYPVAGALTPFIVLFFLTRRGK